jgi:RES domain-containing protein
LLNLPSRVVGAQPFWHQGAVRRDVVALAQPPRYEGRFHVAGGPAVWYASSKEQAAWAELLRHFLDDGVDPFEIRRRVARVRVEGLKVLDLTTDSVRRAVGITLDELTGDDYESCQRVAQLAREHGLDGILSPSAALADNTTLAVFDLAIERVKVELSRVSTPPPRLADLLSQIRLHRDVPATVRSFVRLLETLGSEAIRRRRGQD